MAALSWFVRHSRSRLLEARKNNERESFDSCSGERSQDRVNRDWSWNAGVARRCCGDARGASFRLGKHQDNSDSEPFRREAVAAKANRPGARRLQVIADLARWWRRVWTTSSSLLEENVENFTAAGVS